MQLQRHNRCNTMDRCAVARASPPFAAVLHVGWRRKDGKNARGRRRKARFGKVEWFGLLHIGRGRVAIILLILVVGTRISHPA